MSDYHRPVERIVELSSAVTQLIESTADAMKQTLVDQRARDETRRRRSSLTLSGLGIAILAMLVFVTIVAVGNHRVGNRIVACTTPGTPCFNDTQEQLNQRIAFRIQDAISRNQETLDFMLGCVDPQSTTLCAKQRDERLAKIIHDAIEGAP